MAMGDTDAATVEFTRAARLLQERDMPMESALACLSLARAMARQGDAMDAELQVAAARRIFERAQARSYLEQCEAVRQEIKPQP